MGEKRVLRTAASNVCEPAQSKSGIAQEQFRAKNAGTGVNNNNTNVFIFLH
jgi:hypothetical protein